MKQYIKHLFILALGMISLSSCVNHHVATKTFFKTDEVRLEMSMQDMEYLGTVTVNAEYKTYLGIFTKGLTINDQLYDTRNYTKTHLANVSSSQYSKFITKALYKVTDTYADADYVIPTSHKKDVEHMIGGRIIKESLTLKVYRLK